MDFLNGKNCGYGDGRAAQPIISTNCGWEHRQYSDSFHRSIVLTVILLLMTRGICTAMSTPQEAVEGTVLYLTICFIGIPFITAYNVISSIFRGLGDSKSPMYFIAAACAANITLDYLFMGALKMGPAGAALGTTFSQAFSVLLALLVIRRRKLGVSVGKKHFRPFKERMTHILRIGTPIALQDGFIQIAFIFITIIANRRGLDDAAAVGIMEKIMSFMFLVPSSMLSAVSALCAQNIGGRVYWTRKTDASVCNHHYGVFRRSNCSYDAISRRTDDIALYGRRVSRWSRSSAAWRSIYAWLHMGLHICGDTFLFQWVFLCLRKIGNFLSAQLVFDYS